MKTLSILLISSFSISVSALAVCPTVDRDSLQIESSVEVLNPKKMIYPIYVYGSDVLREPTTEITKEFPELEQLIKDMFSTMYDSEGVGIAAPQIGKSIRLFIVDVPAFEDADRRSERFMKIFINPKIYSYSDEVCTETEGCLSVPGLSEEVVRPIAVKIKYLDENFVEHDSVFVGFNARVIQHEYDHLEGILYTDRVEQSVKPILVDKLNTISRGEFNATYKTMQTK